MIYVNNTPAANSVWKDVIDYHVDMDCDQWVEDVKKRRFDIWERQLTLDLGKVTKKLAASPFKGKSKQGKIFKEVEQENEIKARPKVKATGTRKPLGSRTGNTAPAVAPKKNFTIPICPPTPPPTNGCRSEKKSVVKRAPNTPYNPPSLPSTPTGRRKMFMPKSALATPPHASPSPPRLNRMIASVEIKTPSKLSAPYSPRGASSGVDQSPLPKAKRRMLESKVVNRKGLEMGVELEVCGALTPVKVLTSVKPSTELLALERRSSRRLSKLPVEVSA